MIVHPAAMRRPTTLVRLLYRRRRRRRRQLGRRSFVDKAFLFHRWRFCRYFWSVL